MRECLPSRFLILSKTSSLFGQPGSQYDFSKIDIGQLKDRARELEEQQRGMKKKVNPKVMNMIDTCVLAALLSKRALTWTTLCQRREAGGEPEEDARHGAEGQGEDRANDRGAGQVQARRVEDDVGESQRVIVIPES